MELYDYYIDYKYGLRLGYDRINIGGGRGWIIDNKEPPYGAVIKIIFV